MARIFAEHHAHAPDGQRVLVRQMNENFNDLLVGNVMSSLVDAKTALQRCITRCQSSPLETAVAAEGEYYFLYDFRRKQDKLFYVISILDLAYHGLQHTTFLKVGKDIDKNQPKAMGSVSRFLMPDPVGDQMDQAGMKRPRPSTPEPQHPAKEYFERKDLQTGQSQFTGAIKLHESLFQHAGRSVLGIVTLIHEATHKFAGTIDYMYFENGKQPEGFTSKRDALINADSYAWFACNLGILS